MKNYRVLYLSISHYNTPKEPTIARRIHINPVHASTPVSLKYEVEDMEIIGSGCETAYGAMMMAESYDPYANYKAHIESAISISAKYNYGISLPVKILNT